MRKLINHLFLLQTKESGTIGVISQTPAASRAWLSLSPPTICVEKLYKILDKSNCIVNFRSMSKILTHPTSRKAVLKRLGRRLENCDGKEFF